MPMYNSIEYSDNYAKTSGSLWQYCLDISAVNNNATVNFTENNLIDSFSFKVKITGQTGDDGTKNVEIMVPLKYLSNFWRTLEMPLINCEINLILRWSANSVIVSTNIANQNATFEISDTKLYVPVFFFFFNWYSLHARLNSHYEAWSYKEKKHKKVKAYRKSN